MEILMEDTNEMRNDNNDLRFEGIINNTYDISFEEFYIAVRSVQRGKAPEHDSIKVKLIK